MLQFVHSTPQNCVVDLGPHTDRSTGCGSVLHSFQSFPISQCAAIYVLVCLTAAAVRLGCTTENRAARKWKHGALSPPREHELICCNITGQEGGTALSINVIVTRTGPPQLAASCCSKPLLSAAFAVRLLADNPIQSFGHVLAGPV